MGYTAEATPAHLTLAAPECYERLGTLAQLNPPIRDWTGRVVWLVGASSGIGLATAQRLHAAGARVVVGKKDQCVRLINPANYDYYQMLRAKLHWGENF